MALYSGNLHSMLPRLQNLMDKEVTLPWARVWLRFFYAAMQYEVGDESLTAAGLEAIAADAEYSDPTSNSMLP